MLLSPSLLLRNLTFAVISVELGLVHYTCMLLGRHAVEHKKRVEKLVKIAPKCDITNQLYRTDEWRLLQCSSFRVSGGLAASCMYVC